MKTFIVSVLCAGLLLWSQAPLACFFGYPEMGSESVLRMSVIWEKREHTDAAQALKAWFREASNADWTSPAAIKASFGTASIVGNNRVVFNICGNKYRLVVKVNYPFRVMYIRFIGTHAQYDRIDVEEV